MLFLRNFVPLLANYDVEPKKLLASYPEYFTYSFTRLQAFAEAVYSSVTGKAAAWANTGAIGHGSKEELYNLLVIVLIVNGVVCSVVQYLENGASTLSNVLPLWGIWQMYWPFVRVSIQEYFGYDYSSMHGGLVFNWLAGAAIMSFTVAIQVAHNAYEKTHGGAFY